MPNNQIKASGLVSGSTYYLVINNQTAQYYYTVTPAFENYNSAHWASYANASGTANTAGDWFGTFPALAAGVYEVSLRLRAGGSAAISDTVLGGNTVSWDGTNIAEPLAASQIATGVWQDATAGDFTVSGSIGLSLFTGFAPGNTLGGLVKNNAVASFSALTVNGSTTLNTLNIAGAVTFGSTWTVTGAITLTAGGIPANVTQLAGNTGRATNLSSAFTTGVTAVAAVGSVSLNSMSLPPNGALCNITDAIGTVGVFQFQATDPGVNIWINTSSGDVNTIIGLWSTAIGLNLQIVPTIVGSTINLVQGTAGTVGNVLITVTDASITVVGMRNGVDAVTAGQLTRVDGSNFLEVDASSGGSSDYKGTARGGTTTTIQLATSADATDNYYVGQYVVVNRGLLTQQSRPISSYVGSTKIITITGTWTNAPTNTTPYEIVGQSLPPLITVNQTVIEVIQG